MLDWLFGNASGLIVDDCSDVDWDAAADDALGVHAVETECPAESWREEPDGHGSLYYCDTCGDELDI